MAGIAARVVQRLQRRAPDTLERADAPGREVIARVRREARHDGRHGGRAESVGKLVGRSERGLV